MINHTVTVGQINVVSRILVTEMKRHKMSKKDVAEATGISINTVGNICKGRNATFHSIVAVAAALGMSLDVLAKKAAACSDFPKVSSLSSGPAVPSADKAMQVMASTGQPTEIVEKRMGLEPGKLIEIIP